MLFDTFPDTQNDAPGGAGGALYLDAPLQVFFTSNLDVLDSML